MVLYQRISRILVLVSLLAIYSLIAEPASAAPEPDAVNLYNQACDASTAGNIPHALKIFQQAMQAGFDDLRFAQTDPDLASLAASPEFHDLIIAHQSNLILLSSERGFELQIGKWTDWAELESSAGSKNNPAAVRLKWQPLGLEYEVRVTGDLAASFNGRTVSPARGGPGVIITLAAKDGISPYESANTFHFLLGKDKSGGSGSLFLPQLPNWQQINELKPEITSENNGKSALVSGTINWQIILPFHPLVDTTLGLNVAVKGDASHSNSQVLFPDPHIFSPGAEIHRFHPVVFDTNTWPTEGLAGKLGHSLAEEKPLACDLTVVSSESGTGYLKLDFLDDQGNSVIPDGAQPMPQKLSAGVNTLSHTADFKALRLGPYLVKAEMEMPSGAQLVWSSLVLNIGPDWENQFTTRIKEQRPLDQPTANFYFETISTGIRNLAVRRHPGSLTTTVLELDSMLNAGAKQGSILPGSGVFLLVRTDNPDARRFISLYLPQDYKKTDSLEPVVLWAGAPGAERGIAGRIGKFCEHADNSKKPGPVTEKSNPIFLIPHAPATPFANLDEEVAALEETLTWIQEYFQVNKVALAGSNAASGAVLELSLQNPEILSRILIFSGANLEPWPESGVEQLQKKFATRAPSYPPLTWINFPIETESLGQGKLLLSVLDEAGYIVKPVQHVKGGLSLSQVTDRLVLWAE